MKNVFIYANGFVTRMIIRELKYLLRLEIDNVVLLMENHKPNDFIENTKILFFKSLQECIQYSDIVIIVKDKNTREERVEHIKSQMCHNDKMICEIYSPWIINTNVTPAILFDSLFTKYQNIDFDCVPVILNLSVGILSQQYCLEIMLNEIMSENNINCLQLFSSQTYDFLNQLNFYKILNNNISTQLDGGPNEYSAIIISLYIGENIDRIEYYYELSRNILPDYVVLQIDNSVKSMDYVNTNCFDKFDAVIKSRNHLVAENVVCFCNKEYAINNERIFEINDKKLKEKISFDILSKIGLPDGVVEL